MSSFDQETAVEPRPRRGSWFGKYELIASLGRGGMADVFLAVARGPAGFNKLIVIKRLRASIAEDPSFRLMFLDEARLAARLNHPNVVQTNEVGEHDGYYFLAMEYLEGQPLRRVSGTRSGPWSPPGSSPTRCPRCTTRTNFATTTGLRSTSSIGTSVPTTSSSRTT